MRKILIGLVIVVLSFAVAMAVDYAGYKEYAPAPQPDNLYFIVHTNVPQGTSMIAWTNREAYAWRPSEVRFATRPEKGFTNEFTFNKITVIPIEAELKYTITTNEFGNLQTNWVHGITNVSYLYITNSIISSVTTNTTNHVFELNYSYVQYGDILQFSWTDTTNKWLSITATR